MHRWIGVHINRTLDGALIPVPLGQYWPITRGDLTPRRVCYLPGGSARHVLVSCLSRRVSCLSRRGTCSRRVCLGASRVRDVFVSSRHLSCLRPAEQRLHVVWLEIQRRAGVRLGELELWTDETSRVNPPPSTRVYHIFWAIQRGLSLAVSPVYACHNQCDLGSDFGYKTPLALPRTAFCRVTLRQPRGVKPELTCDNFPIHAMLHEKASMRGKARRVLYAKSHKKWITLKIAMNDRVDGQ